jgi:tRNA (adenine57-N1/adenine58-N1)-methyltransferase
MIEPGQLVLLVSPKGKRYLRKYDEKDVLHTNEGHLSLSEAAAAGYGGLVRTHLGRPYRILKPTLYDLVKNVRRQTQIIYPKDIGYIAMRLSAVSGARIVEAGSGSGSLTVALAALVGPAGKVYTYERRPEFKKLCTRNLEWAGFGDGRVEQFDRDIAEGFLPHAADALFLDVRTPWEYLQHIPGAVLPGAPLGFLLPTVPQVADLLAGLEAGPFEELEVLEILLRRWKPVSERLRPDDRMVAHTGFLVFARLTAGERLASEPAAGESEVDAAEADEGLTDQAE